MSKFIKLNPTKPFIIPIGYRLGRIIINGELKERSIKSLNNSNRNIDNQFLRKIQKRLLERKLNDYFRRIIRLFEKE